MLEDNKQIIVNVNTVKLKLLFLSFNCFNSFSFSSSYYFIFYSVCLYIFNLFSKHSLSIFYFSKRSLFCIILFSINNYVSSRFFWISNIFYFSFYGILFLKHLSATAFRSPKLFLAFVSIMLFSF